MPIDPMYTGQYTNAPNSSISVLDRNPTGSPVGTYGERIGGTGRDIMYAGGIFLTTQPEFALPAAGLYLIGKGFSNLWTDVTKKKLSPAEEAALHEKLRNEYHQRYGTRGTGGGTAVVPFNVPEAN